MKKVMIVNISITLLVNVIETTDITISEIINMNYNLTYHVEA